MSSYAFRSSFDPFSSTSAVVRPSGYVLRPACDCGGHWNALIGVGGDLGQHVAWQIFRPGPGKSANRVWNGLEPAWPPRLVDESHVVLPLSQGRRTHDNIRLRNIAARVEFPNKVFCRFYTRIGMAYPQPFDFDKTISQCGNNSDIFSLASQFFQHRRCSFVWQNTVAWVDNKRENGSVLLMSEEMTGQDGYPRTPPAAVAA
jgi:hypothetical protein